jgi:hypothetical protein
MARRSPQGRASLACARMPPTHRRAKYACPYRSRPESARAQGRAGRTRLPRETQAWRCPRPRPPGDCGGSPRGQRLAQLLRPVRLRLAASHSSQRMPVSDVRPQQDSNLRTRLRRPMLYPLSYGGCATWERVPAASPSRTLRCRHTVARAADKVAGRSQAGSRRGYPHARDAEPGTAGARRRRRRGD